MKKICLIAFFWVTHLPDTHAQRHPEPSPSVDLSLEDKAQNITEEMGIHITLTQEQRLGIQQTWAEFFESVQELWQNDQRVRSSTQKAMRKIEQERDLKMKGILNEEQYTDYEEFMKTGRTSGSKKAKRGS